MDTPADVWESWLASTGPLPYLFGILSVVGLLGVAVRYAVRGVRQL